MKNNRLKPGELAPLFAAKDWQGIDIDLKQHKGKIVLLSFYRYASCPLCNLRIRELIQAHDVLAQKGLVVFAVFQSPAKVIARYVGQQAPPFPLIPDPQMINYRIFGVESSWIGFFRSWTLSVGKVFKAVVGNRFLPGTVEGDLNRIPADFLINSEGKLIDVYYGVDIGDHMPMQRIVDALKSHTSI